MEASMTTPQRTPVPLPDDESARTILDKLTGSRDATLAMLAGTRWPNAELAGPEELAATVLSAPAAGIAGAGGATAGEIILGGGIAGALAGTTVEAGIQGKALYDDLKQQAADVKAAIARFHMDRNKARDVLAARAFVFSLKTLPVVYFGMAWDKTKLDKTAQLIMQYELVHPGTAMAASRGNWNAQAAIDALVTKGTGENVNDLVADAAAAVLVRPSKVHPALSADSAEARKILAIRNLQRRGQRWQAHHLIPFAVVARLDEDVQLAIVQSRWKMDSAENLIALPADWATFFAEPNNKQRPVHALPDHPIYSAETDYLLGPAVRYAKEIARGNNTSQSLTKLCFELRFALKDVELTQRTKLTTGVIWPEVVSTADTHGARAKA
jgi:hypothetical protein